MPLISLPQNLKTSFLYEDKPVDLSNWTPLTIEPAPELTLETKDGVLKPKSIKEVAELLGKYSVTFTYSPPGKNDAILSVLSDEQLIMLNVFGKIDIDGIIVNKIKNNLRIDSIPIYNLIAQTKTYRGEGLETCLEVAEEVIRSRAEFGLYNPGSGAAEARALMCQDEAIFDEILLSRKLGIYNLDKFNMACYGGRMESSGIGSLYQAHYDMIKAHLNILKQYPGIRGTTWVKGQTSARYFNRALPHSIYYIKTTIPRKFKYNPLPVKTDAGTKYPSGDIINWYFKDYLDLLTTLNIPFTILDSIQFIGEGNYPFNSYSHFISAIIKIFDSQFPDLESKHLYSTIAGSCKSIYKALEKNLSQSYTASKVYNPVIYGFVLARQNVELYLKALETNAEAIKIDSIATNKKYNLGPSYRFKGEGESIYLTPALKSVPGGKQLYKEAIRRCKDVDKVVIELNVWNSLQGYLSDSIIGDHSSANLGEKYRKIISIKPHYGSRDGRAVKRVGELLNAWLVSTPGGGINERDINLLKLEEYSGRFSDG